MPTRKRFGQYTVFIGADTGAEAGGRRIFYAAYPVPKTVARGDIEVDFAWRATGTRMAAPRREKRLPRGSPLGACTRRGLDRAGARIRLATAA